MNTKKLPINLPSRSVFKDLSIQKSSTGYLLKTKNQTYDLSKYHPILAKILSRLDLQKKLSDSVFGPTPPNAFVGEYGYPSVQAGPMVNLQEGEDYSFYDRPENWFINQQDESNYWKIISSRSNMLRAKQLVNVKTPNRFVEQIQDSVASIHSVDLEVDFVKPPEFSLYFSSIALPNGPSGQMKKFRISSNPSVPSLIDELKEEKLLVNDSINLMLEKGFDNYYIQKILSAGLLGKNPKVVPTKWSITASDDLIGKIYLKRIRSFPQINDLLLFSNNAFGNNFQIILSPGNFEFEQFEAWEQSTPWSNNEELNLEYDYEGFYGRTKYSSSEGGGYYAGRFSCIKHLLDINRQAKVTVIREINSNYLVPLGVAQVRENVAQAFKKKPLKFSNLKELTDVISTRLTRPAKFYFSRSRIFSQKRLSDWFVGLNTTK